MTKQQALFNREREQAARNWENTVCEWKEMKRLKDQILT